MSLKKPLTLLRNGCDLKKVWLVMAGISGDDRGEDGAVIVV